MPTRRSPRQRQAPDFPGPGHHLRQSSDVVVDLDRFQHLTGIRHPHDHRPATTQVDTDGLGAEYASIRASFFVT